MFNYVKSELKIIESGMKRKALIAQDFGIYKELLKNNETALLVSDNKKGWYKVIKELITNPDLREKLANNLHDFVKDKYELKNVTDDRVEFYKQIIKDKKSGKLK
jgi:glycosyltransferase involved in cell wall biosynthesis